MYKVFTEGVKCGRYDRGALCRGTWILNIEYTQQTVWHLLQKLTGTWAAVCLSVQHYNRLTFSSVGRRASLEQVLKVSWSVDEVTYYNYNNNLYFINVMLQYLQPFRWDLLGNVSGKYGKLNYKDKYFHKGYSKVINEPVLLVFVHVKWNW